MATISGQLSPFKSPTARLLAAVALAPEISNLVVKDKVPVAEVRKTDMLLLVVLAATMSG